MRFEELKDFIGKKVRISSVVQTNDKPQYLYYSGLVLSVNDETLRLRDKFDKLVIFMNDTILHIAEE
jgi:hypothetical protein